MTKVVGRRPDEVEKAQFNDCVGVLVRQKRKERGFGCVELATAVGVADTTLSKIESGLYPCPLFVLVRIAMALDCDLDDLVPADWS